MLRPSRTLRSIRTVIRSHHANGLTSEASRLQADIIAAKQLHARIYQERGYITGEDVGPNGMMDLAADPYQAHAEYFVVKLKGRIVATARQIIGVPDLGHNSFPTIKSHFVRASVQREIQTLDPARCVEISGLAKDHGVDPAAVLLLYRAMWHYSLQAQHAIWLMACDRQAFRRLTFLFGSALEQIGDPVEYMGSQVVPARLNVERSIIALEQQSKTLNPFKRLLKRRLVHFLLDGLPESSKAKVTRG